jgi:hypothetical protein
VYLLFDDRHGPMGLAIKERRHVFRRESGCLDSRPAEVSSNFLPGQGDQISGIQRARAF